MAKRRLPNHKRKNHHKDLNNTPVEYNGLEIATGKKIEEEDHGDSTKGNKVRPRDKLVTDVDYPTAQIPTKPTMSMSCSSCTFEISCRTMKLAKQILQNHQRRRHTSDSDGGLVEETQDEYDEIIGIMMTIDNREEPTDDEPKNVQKTNAEGDKIDGNCKGKKDRYKDLPQFELMDKIDVTRIWMGTLVPA